MGQTLHGTTIFPPGTRALGIERKFIKVRSYGEHMLMYSWMGWCSEAVAIKVFHKKPFLA